MRVAAEQLVHGVCEVSELRLGQLRLLVQKVEDAVVLALYQICTKNNSHLKYLSVHVTLNNS